MPVGAAAGTQAAASELQQAYMAQQMVRLSQPSASAAVLCRSAARGGCARHAAQRAGAAQGGTGDLHRALSCSLSPLRLSEAFQSANLQLQVQLVQPPQPAAQAGVEASGGFVLLADRPLTTPVLHWSVQQLNVPRNNGATLAELADHHLLSLREAYARLLTGAAAPQVLSTQSLSNAAHFDSTLRKTPPALQDGHRAGLERLCIDCANGVGALALQQMELPWQLYNTGEGGLNDQCGADYVQKERAVPAGCSSIPESAQCAVSILHRPEITSTFCSWSRTATARMLWCP